MHQRVHVKYNSIINQEAKTVQVQHIIYVPIVLILSLVQKTFVMCGTTVCGVPINSKYIRLGVNQCLFYYISPFLLLVSLSDCWCSWNRSLHAVLIKGGSGTLSSIGGAVESESGLKNIQ